MTKIVAFTPKQENGYSEPNWSCFNQFANNAEKQMMKRYLDELFYSGLCKKMVILKNIAGGSTNLQIMQGNGW